ncbi:hypothetical protein NXX53_14090 [Bacteroides salyersiae]|nr:hypothetical protein [Bacteroides salyersiae]
MRNHLPIIVSIWILIGSVFCIWSCVNSIGEEEDEKTDTVIPGNIPIKISAKTLHSQIYRKDCDDAIGLYVLISPTTLDKERYIENRQFKCKAFRFCYGGRSLLSGRKEQM